MDDATGWADAFGWLGSVLGGSLFLLVAVVLLAIGLAPDLRKKVVTDPQVRASRRLKSYRTDESTVGIVVFPAHQMPLARKVAGIFRVAEWNVNLTETPQEAFMHRYVEGVTVRGVNASLVHAVAATLSRAGVPQVREDVQDEQIPAGHPKYQLAQHSIQVQIGHTPEG